MTHTQVLWHSAQTNAYACLQIFSRVNPGLILVYVRLAASPAHVQAGRLWAERIGALGGGLFVRILGSSLLCKSAVTSGSLNYLLSLMVISHSSSSTS